MEESPENRKMEAGVHSVNQRGQKKIVLLQTDVAFITGAECQGKEQEGSLGKLDIQLSEIKHENKERKSPKGIEKEAYTYICSHMKQGRAEEYEPR